jgi:hypothetical protein
VEQRVVDPLEVTRARDDMKLLQHEVDVLENNRLHFEAELTAAKAKADSIEEVINYIYYYYFKQSADKINLLCCL